MNDDERLAHLLRAALRPADSAGPSRDLWPSVANRMEARVRLSWLDVGVAAAVAVALLMRPAWLWLLAYHL